jgi:hypothetical protein
MSSASFAIFICSFDRGRGLSHVGRALESQALAGVDISESFRGAVVLALSALDSYIHNLCVEAIVESYLGKRKKNSHYGDAQVRLASAETGVSSSSVKWLESEIRAQFSRDTYQRPDDIAKALRFVDDRRKIWVRIGVHLGDSAESVKARLSSIVDRRNMIVHEADIDPVWGSTRPLSADESDGALDFVFRLGQAIDSECW